MERSPPTIAGVARALRAHLEAESELGGEGLPRVEVSSRGPGRARTGTETAVAGAPVPVLPVPTARAGQEPPGEARPAPVAPEARRVRLAELESEAAACTRCALHEGRQRVVFARGSPEAELAFVGEGPGREEDVQGLPFVGPAGKLLDRMIAAMGYEREAVYVCNVVKCRPPENRTPRPDEAIACSRFLVPQLELVGPKVIVALGRCAAENLGVAEPTGSWRGSWGEWRGVPVMPTYHPAFLLRSPQFKRTVWEDLQKVLVRLGRAR